MSVFLYNIFLALLSAGIRIASLFNSKAKKWVEGRKNIFEKLKEAIPQNERITWIHCASLGEFEQGRPLIERLNAQGTRHKEEGSRHKVQATRGKEQETRDKEQGTRDKAQGTRNKILLTFFSPSGYEVQKRYEGADWIFYLPLDGPANAKRFLEIVKPSLVIFVKYEFWYYYLKKIKYRNIPLLLVSALFRKDMSFFKWYGGLQRKMLSRFDHLFVQNEESKRLIDDIGLGHICSISGDTRFDRVIEIAEKFEPIPLIDQFIANKKTIIAGSTWKEDEEVLQKVFLSVNDASLKLIIAPHEINETHINDLKKLFPDAVLFSQLTTLDYRLSTPKVLIIDNIGMLSRLYHYAWLTYVGGGLATNGVHNVLEAAVYGKPVIIGPFYEKYREAIGLVKSGGAIVIKDDVEFSNCIQTFLQNGQSVYDSAANASKNYVWKNKGATDKILQFIQEKRLLTS